MKFLQLNRPTSVTNVTLQTFPGVIREFGWSPNAPWVPELRREYATMAREGSPHRAQQWLYRQLDLETYADPDKLIVTTGYQPGRPSPLEVSRRLVPDLDKRVAYVCVAAEASTLLDKGGKDLLTLTQLSRKVAYHTDDHPAAAASRFLQELTGLEINSSSLAVPYTELTRCQPFSVTCRDGDWRTITSQEWLVTL